MATALLFDCPNPIFKNVFYFVVLKPTKRFFALKSLHISTLKTCRDTTAREKERERERVLRKTMMTHLAKLILGSWCARRLTRHGDGSVKNSFHLRHSSQHHGRYYNATQKYTHYIIYTVYFAARCRQQYIYNTKDANSAKPREKAKQQINEHIPLHPTLSNI